MSLQFQVIVQNSIEKSLWQELGIVYILSRAERNAHVHAHSLAPSSVCPLIQFRTTCLRNGATHSEMELSTSINTQASPTDRPTGQPISQKTLFPDDSIVCQVNN